MASSISVDSARPRAGAMDLRTTRVAVAVAAVAAVVLPVAWLVVAAAQRPSVLSPPTGRGAAAVWMLGPLRGLMQGVARAPNLLHSDMLRVLIIVGVAWLLAWILASALSVRVLAGAVVAVHAVLFLGPPLPLTDVFNYDLYGRMAADHGLNPYRAVPALASSDPIYGFANWHHLSSPYGPLFTLASEGLGVFGLHGWYWAWKVVVALSSLGSVALTVAIAGRLGVSRQRALVALGLSPLLLIGEVGGLHQDMPAVACLLGAAWCLVRARDERDPAGWWVDPLAGVLVVAAAAVKPSFAIVVGIVVLGARHRLRAAAGAAAAGLVAGAIVLLVYGGALPDVATQSSLVSPLSVPNLLGLAAGHGGADHAVRSVAQDLLIVFALGVTAMVALQRERALNALGILLFGSMLALSWVMPWYLVWALPFIALARPRWLAPLAVVATAWLTIGGLPTMYDVLHWFGYFPAGYPTGRVNHLELVRLLR